MSKNNPATIGDNSGVESYAKRIISLLNEQDALKEDVKEIYLEAKGAEIDVTALRTAIRVTRKDRDFERMITVNQYLERLGELPLFALSKS